MEGSVPVSVVVASHARHLRLRWLLNALEEQTLPTDSWEVMVVHDYDARVAEPVLDRHPLAATGVLRHIPIEPGTGSPSRQRNLGWRAARGELVAFTDDDCRPDPEWLERLLAVARREPSAVVQGRTRPDPFEAGVFGAPHVRTLTVEPVGLYAECANILYPRALLERLDGFDETAITGEDVELSLRARSLGVRIVAAPEAIVNHSVESHTLPGIVRQNLKWRYLPYVVKRHPEFRRKLPLGVFWDGDHLLTAVAVLGLVAARRRRIWLALTVPYAVQELDHRGPGARARTVAAAEIPGQTVRRVAEVLGMIAGGVRRRTFVL